MVAFVLYEDRHEVAVASPPDLEGAGNHELPGREDEEGLVVWKKDGDYLSE